MTEGLHLNDDRSPLIDLLSCFVCDETMKIEKSAPDPEFSIVAHGARESNPCDCSGEVGAEGEGEIGQHHCCCLVACQATTAPQAH